MILLHYTGYLFKDCKSAFMPPNTGSEFIVDICMTSWKELWSSQCKSIQTELGKIDTKSAAKEHFAETRLTLESTTAISKCDVLSIFGSVNKCHMKKPQHPSIVSPIFHRRRKTTDEKGYKNSIENMCQMPRMAQKLLPETLKHLLLTTTKQLLNFVPTCLPIMERALPRKNSKGSFKTVLN